MLFLVLLVFACTPKKQTEAPTISYLEQEHPDNIPQVFGKGIVSVKGRFDMGLTISLDGKSIAFGVNDYENPKNTCIYLMNHINGEWSSPDKSFLPDNINTFFPMFSPDGDQLYFAKSTGDSPTDLWVAQYNKQKAINPQPLDAIFNSAEREAGHGKSKSGTFYFTSNRDDQYQCCGDIYFAQQTADGYHNVQRSVVLSSPADEESLFLSPDEDHIIIQAWKYGSETKHDLSISYRTSKDEWTVPKRLNSLINSKEIEQRPFVSPDDKFLFFSRTIVTQENEQDVYDSDIFWVSTKSVFAPYVYNTQIAPSISYKEAFELQFPKDLFKDVDDDKLSFQLRLDNDTAIPEWMAFDAAKLLLKGTWNTKEALMLTLIATDSYGNAGEFRFKLAPQNQ
jgi:hypothetical protein